MTGSQPDDDSALGDLSKELPAIDLDHATAERMAHRLRQDLGRPPSPRRFVLPVIVAITLALYATWTLLKLLEIFA